MLKTKPEPIKPNNVPINKLLIGLIFICFVLQAFMVLKFEINQDEFYSLNIAYEVIRGDFTNPFQSFFFRLSRILQYVPGNEADQIVVGRLAMYICAAITCLLIYKISRRYFSVEASLFAVLSFFSIGFVFRHLTAYRYDIVVTTLLMTVLWVVSDPEQNWKKVIAAGLLIGLSFTFALKSIFYIPIVAVFLLTRWVTSSWSRRAFLHGLIMFVVAISTYSVLYMLHNTGSYGSDQGTEYLKRISGNSFFVGLLRKGPVFQHSLQSNILAYWLMGVGILAVALELKTGAKRSRSESIGILSLAFSLLPIIFYFHANPYFYPFMLAPAVVFVAAAADRFLSENRSLFIIAFTGIFCVLIGMTFIKSMGQHQKDQRATLDVVHSIFPNPVSVIDYCGMISSFDRVNESGLFMNPDIFSMERYTVAGHPVMHEIIPKFEPKIILSNAARFARDHKGSGLFDSQLLAEDTALIKDNYLRFWGEVYIPGKQLQNDPSVEILVGGTYTYYGLDQVRIDGAVLQSGQTVELSQGLHSVSGLTSDDAKIIWGDNLKKPDIPEPTGPLFNGF